MENCLFSSSFFLYVFVYECVFECVYGCVYMCMLVRQVYWVDDGAVYLFQRMLDVIHGQMCPFQCNIHNMTAASNGWEEGRCEWDSSQPARDTYIIINYQASAFYPLRFTRESLSKFSFII